jgi:hypothetical protein
MLPVGDRYDQVKLGDVGLPASKLLWRMFGSISRAWLAALPRRRWYRVPLLRCGWTEEEGHMLLDLAGIRTLPEIGQRLHRSAEACRRRLYELGTTARDAQGYLSAHQLADAYGCPPSRVIRLIKWGRLPAQLIHGNRYAIDPVDAEAVADELTAPKRTFRDVPSAAGGRGRRAGATGSVLLAARVA